MTPREFWSTKSPRPEFHTVTFSQPAFEVPIRLVANQFDYVTLGGNSYRPAPMQIQTPDQTGVGQAALKLSFPRQVVGREFKQQLKRIGASREPVAVTYALFLDGIDAPAISWDLYVSEQGGVVFTLDAVQVTATDSNPMRRQVGPIYDPGIFTGLSII